MDTEPRSPLHRPRFNPPQALPEEEAPIQAPVPVVPNSNVPDYGDKPEQLPQANGRRKKRQKSVI